MRTWHCLTCADHPRFSREQAIAHLSEHGLSITSPARRERIAAIDGLKSAIEIYIWAYPNGIRLQETVCSVSATSLRPRPIKPALEVTA